MTADEASGLGDFARTFLLIILRMLDRQAKYLLDLVSLAAAVLFHFRQKYSHRRQLIQ